MAPPLAVSHISQSRLYRGTGSGPAGNSPELDAILNAFIAALSNWMQHQPAMQQAASSAHAGNGTVSGQQPARVGACSCTPRSTLPPVSMAGPTSHVPAPQHALAPGMNGGFGSGANAGHAGHPAHPATDRHAAATRRSGAGTTAGDGDEASAGPADASVQPNAAAHRADVMIGSYVDPQNLAAQRDLARDPRVGLFSNQIGFVTRLNDQQRNSVLDTFRGKDMTIERASYDDYGPNGNNGLHDQFTRHTDGKTRLNIQTADLDAAGNLSAAESAANVRKMENDIRTQKALGNTLIPVVGPNTPAGQKQSYAAGFDSPEFDSWRSLAKQAGGLMFDSPPDLMANLPGYAKFNQDATHWLHENGLLSLWYGAAGGHDPNYQANVEKTVQNMNATHSNPDQYILSGYDDGDAQGTVAAEARASRYILEHTRPV